MKCYPLTKQSSKKRATSEEGKISNCTFSPYNVDNRSTLKTTLKEQQHLKPLEMEKTQYITTRTEISSLIKI